MIHIPLSRESESKKIDNMRNLAPLIGKSNNNVMKLEQLNFRDINVSNEKQRMLRRADEI